MIYMSSTKQSNKDDVTEVTPNDIEHHVKKYIAQLSPQEKLVLDIAVSHLESSFEITKSIGFVKWFAEQ